MLFNSIDFAIFLPLVFVIYWLLNKRLKLQNLFLLIASYVFYGWWDWRFLSLILFSTVVDYLVGLKLNKTQHNKRRLLYLWISIVVNIGFLGFFKYYNFFLENFKTAFTFFGAEFQANSLHIILPVGISFYTFQTLSYTIDIYNKKLKPTRDFIAFGAFVSFFPQLVAGPIERAKNLLPQFYRNRRFTYPEAVAGLRQILWGFIKKVVIADNCAQFADMIFNNYQEYSGSTLLLGALFFTFQIYGDFSGYSDIAIGTARLFGFRLMKNFAFPYFSRDIAEFWRRWHISLSTWFRDYLYIPIGGSRGTLAIKVRNIFIIFVVSGFWHGANWTFIVWGALNAFYFLPLLLANKNRKHMQIVAKNSTLPRLKELYGMAITFSLTVLAWIFFRSNSVAMAVDYIATIFSESLFVMPEFSNMGHALTTLILVVIFMIAEWFGRTHEHAFAQIGSNWKRLSRWALYSGVVFIILMYMQTNEAPFIYFQF